MAHRPSVSVACGIFLDQGLNLSPALASRFFTTELPGKPITGFLKDMIKDAIVHQGRDT